MSIETDSPIVYHGTSETQLPRYEVAKKLAEGLNEEERRTLRQCNKESFYYRCLPLAIAGVAATQLAVKRGFLIPHPVWGSTVPMTGAAFFGWIVGKLSYRSKCEDKFLHVEGAFGDTIRRKRGILSERRYKSEFPKTQTSEDNMNLRDDSSFSYYSDSNFHPSSGSLNLDVDKNVQYSGLDDRERPSTDREAMQFTDDNEIEPVKRFTTYEELRHRNREEYEKLQKPYSSRIDLMPSSDQKPWSTLDTTPPRRYNSDLRENEARRMDGDAWDNAQNKIEF